MEARVVRLEEKAHNMDEIINDLSARFLKHVDKEEIAFERLYERLRDISDEIQKAFSERDKAINSLDKRIVKLLAYATAAFTVLTLLIQVGIKAI